MRFFPHSSWGKTRPLLKTEASQLGAARNSGAGTGIHQVCSLSGFSTSFPPPLPSLTGQGRSLHITAALVSSWPHAAGSNFAGSSALHHALFLSPLPLAPHLYSDQHKEVNGEVGVTGGQGMRGRMPVHPPLLPPTPATAFPASYFSPLLSPTSTSYICSLTSAFPTACPLAAFFLLQHWGNKLKMTPPIIRF